MRHRYLIVGMMALASFWLYIDRVCFSTLAKPMTGELLLALAPEPDVAATPTPAEIAAAKRLRPPSAAGVEDLTAEETRAALKRRWADRRMSYALGAFFLTYALFQIPMGSLADRHGARLVLALSIAAWSLVTMATGFVVGFLPLLVIRLLLGITEAGAYPAAAGLLKAWVPQQQRGRCSSVVTLGGRLGGAIAPRLTATLAAALAGMAVVEWIVPRLASTAAAAGPNWRGVFFIYGLCGLAVALLFWMLVRDRPPVPLATEPGGTAAPQRPLSGQMALLATSRNMWLAGALQFGVNLGWAFIVTLLPTYLAEVFDTPLEQIGTMQTVTLAIGCIGMLFGGAFTDLMRSRLGPRYGRSVPVGIALAGCTASFLLVPALPNAWLVILALGAMAFCVDMLVPPLWSFIQDVGGRNVGAALGWGNMWGNLGAALSPVLLTEIRQAAGWNAAFLCCGAACGLGALCGFMLDATRPVDPEPAGRPAVRRTGLTLI